MRFKLAPLFLPLLLAACQTAPATIAPKLVAASVPVPTNEVDDAAFWIHPTDPAKSLLLVTNKFKGLELHDPDGGLLKHIDAEYVPINVDVAYNVALGKTTADLALITCRAENSQGVRIYQIDPGKRRLKTVGETAIIKVLGGTEPLALCTYRSPRSGKTFFFVTSEEGRIEQWEITQAADEHLSVKQVRAFARPSKVKGAVADDEKGILYISEEKTGVWQYNAEPDASADATQIAKVGENGLEKDVLGLALYAAADNKGYLLVVSQGPKGGRSLVKIYDRAAPHAFRLTLDPAANGQPKWEGSSGIAITNRPTASQFPAGTLAVKQRFNPNASEDFKLYSWKQIADQAHLTIDPAHSPRHAP